jgi:hypothetical protein
MSEEKMQKERNWMVKMLPCYLAVQVVTLLLTFMDFGVYYEAYRARGYVIAGGWLGVWAALLVAGLGSAVYLLISRTGKAIELRLRMKLAGGYWLGSLAGLLALGLRFLPIFFPGYFWSIFALLAVSGAAYAAWNRRPRLDEDMFP